MGTLYVSTKLETFELPADTIPIAAEMTLDGIKYRRLDPEYYAWLSNQLLKLKKFVDIGKMEKEKYAVTFSEFTKIHEWAQNNLGRDALSDALSNFQSGEYTPPTKQPITFTSFSSASREAGTGETENPSIVTTDNPGASPTPEGEQAQPRETGQPANQAKPSEPQPYSTVCPVCAEQLIWERYNNLFYLECICGHYESSEPVGWSPSVIIRDIAEQSATSINLAIAGDNLIPEPILYCSKCTYRLIWAASRKSGICQACRGGDNKIVSEIAVSIAVPIESIDNGGSSDQPNLF